MGSLRDVPGLCTVELLRPVHLVERVNALVLSGGSAYGLKTCAGAIKWPCDQGSGFQDTVLDTVWHAIGLAA